MRENGCVQDVHCPPTSINPTNAGLAVNPKSWRPIRPGPGVMAAGAGKEVAAETSAKYRRPA